MTPERRQQIESVYAAVDEAAPADRPAILDRLCGGDTDLRQTVEKLLGEGSPPGRMIGPYRVLQLIGKGGMGEIYAAEDSRLGRQVALKLLPILEFQSAGRVQRFQQEARAASALNHPNILTIHDFGQTEGLYYIATELVQGRTLRQMMADETLSLTDTLAIAIQIASALAAAHAAGIVHRDVKPENVMVRPDGYVKVLDFGLAKLSEPGNSTTGSELKLSTPGVVMGTVRYMSPEQARGMEIDGRSDLFSLGVVLYELAARRTPFQGATQADVIAAILDRDASPFESSAGINEQFEAIVFKCLRKDRQYRYQTAEDLLADLRQLKQLLETSTVAMSAPLRPRRTRDKRVLVAAVLAVLAIAFGVFRWARPGAARWYQTSHLTRIPGSSAFSAGVLSPDGRYIAYSAMLPDGTRTLNLRLQAATSGIELIPAALVAYTGLAFSADGNYLNYASRGLDPGEPSTLFRAPVLGGAPQKLVENMSGKFAVSPDGSLVAFARRQASEGVLSVMAPDGSGQRELLRRRADFAFQSIDWSADSREIFFVETQQSTSGMDCRIFSVSRTGGTPEPIARTGKAFIYDFAVLPDGSGFLANAFDQDAGLQQIWHVGRDGAMRHITHDLSQYQGLSVTRDGRQILSSQVERHSALWVVDRDNPSSARRITESGRRYDTPTWTHGGNIVSVRFEAGSWMLWAMVPGGAARPLLQQSVTDLDPHACPDRDDIVFASARTGPYAIWRVLPDGSGLKQLTPGSNDRYPQCVAGGTVLYWLQTGNQRTGMQVPLDGGAPSFSAPLTANQHVSPDGRLVLAPYTDERTHGRSIALRTRDLSTILATYPYSARVDWAPDSQGYADARGPGRAQEIWYQPVTGGPARQLTRFGEDGIFDLSWSPDGRQLVCARGRFESDLVLIQDVR